MKHFFTLLVLILLSGLRPGYAQTGPAATKPFIMPVLSSSGPSTWIVGQPYGNTTGAFVTGAQQYSAGQFLHFGVDIGMPCGTPVVAVASGIVDSVDNLYRGSAPHNVSLRFPELGLTVLYGHLLERSTLIEGQTIQQGEVVGLSGDPDGDCDSRPHLHLEVRSIDQSVAYNPILYIEAPWNSLLGLDSRLRPAFQRDLSNPRRWMSLIDQPDVYFGGRRLNDYASTWPPPFNRGAPATTLPDLTLSPIKRDWSIRQIMNFGCCAGPWWNQNTIYFVDGGEGQLADIYALPRDAAEPTIVATDTAPPLLSADGSYQVIYQPTQSIIQRLADGAQWSFSIPESFPALSPSNALIFWAQGDDDTGREIWVAALDGSLNQRVWASQGRNASARWLDDDHLLISEREPVPGRYTTLTVVNINDTLAYPLGTWWGVRNIQIAPGGQRLIFFSTFNPDITNNGAFVLDIQPGAVPQRLPWFADYRWRDSSSLFYITFDPATDIQQLNFYDVLSGEFIPLTDPALVPFTIANGDWSVSPDGTAIVFQDARDGNLWLLEQP